MGNEDQYLIVELKRVTKEPTFFMGGGEDGNFNGFYEVEYKGNFGMRLKVSYKDKKEIKDKIKVKLTFLDD